MGSLKNKKKKKKDCKTKESSELIYDLSIIEQTFTNVSDFDRTRADVQKENITKRTTDINDKKQRHGVKDIVAKMEGLRNTHLQDHTEIELEKKQLSLEKIK